jgi:hypothetical protein
VALETLMTLRRFLPLITLVCSASLAGVAHAQQGGGKGEDEVPKAYRPPPGMCRIWLEKVPPKQQPAPTDCPTAIRNRPPNGKVIFGDDYKDRAEKVDRKDPPFLKKFNDDKKRP